MRITSPDPFKQVSGSCCWCSFYSQRICTVCVPNCSCTCSWNTERKTICGGRHRRWTLQRQCTVLREFSPSKSMDLSPCFSLNPTSLPLLSLSSSTFHSRGWQRKELSKALTFWTFLAAILQTEEGAREGGRERESERAKGRNCEIQPLFHGETPGRKDCMSPKSGREGGPAGSTCFLLAL